MNYIDQLKVAVFMVGNIDTPQDKAQWWKNFDHLWNQVAQDPNLEALLNEFNNPTPDPKKQTPP